MTSTRIVRILVVCGVALFTQWSGVLRAQTTNAQIAELRGVVRDSASGAPIAGAVVMALDADARIVIRTIASERGLYRISRPASVTQLRVVRLGFRPATVTLALSNAASTTLNIALVTVPRALEAVDVVAARGCPVRSDRGEAFALLDQARAGLLAAVVARERQPAQIRVLRYERRLDLDGVEIERQLVSVDSSKNATTSFNAVHSAIDFVDNGFRTGRNGAYTYYGPDADVLLDDRFQRGYCFSLAAADTSRRAQVGLHFAPAGRRSGRVDIDGTLWIDTANRTLNEIEFRYLGLEVLAESFGAGGRIGFRMLPNGAPLIDRWSLRLVGAPDTIVTDAGSSSQSYAIREIGGELAHARWPDGSEWSAPLGVANVTAVRKDGSPARGVTLNLVGTDYRTTTDSLGRATITQLVPGPYRFAIDDPRLQGIDWQIPTEREFVSRRGSTSLVRVEAPTPEEYVAASCNSGVSQEPNNALLIARVVGSDRQPLGGIKWRISESRDSKWRVISENGLTPSSGLVMLCRGIERGALLEIAAWRELNDAVRVRKFVDDKLVTVRVPLPTRVIAQQATADAPRATVIGSVRDSSSGALIGDARVTFLGSPFEGATDSTGQFLVGGVPRGTYTVEVSTPFLDSIGAVQRTNVTLEDSIARLALYLPSLQTVMSATCGATTSGSAVIGRLLMRNERPLPAGLQVVAEWRDSEVPSAPLMKWVRAPVEPGGTFRVCGVPADVPLQVRTEADSVTPYAAAPTSVRIASARRFSRTDLMLDSGVVVLPVFTGSVIADSLGTPLENAEVTISDLGRSVLTNQRGAFRVSDIPIGSHVISVKKVGHAPMMTTMEFQANRTIDQRVLLPKATTLNTVNVIATGNGAPPAFDERRKNGIGRYLTFDQLQRQQDRRLSDVLITVPSVAVVTARGGNAYILGKRAPLHLKPTGLHGGPVGGAGSAGGAAGLGQTAATAGSFTDQDLIEQGIYCPSAAEKSHGLECGCYAQVYLDDHLMNGGRPTEPFDINSIPTKNIAGIEFYASPAQTPGQYSNLQARCGVMLIWTRR